MNNVRQFKPKTIQPPITEPSIICCPDCDCEEVILWMLDSVIVPACAECEQVLDLSDYQC